MEATQHELLWVDRLHALVRDKNKPEIEALLKERQPSHIVDRRVNGRTALHVAAQLGLTEIVDLLINEGHADVRARSDPDRDTPLHLAALCGHEAVVEKLLQQGAILDLTVEDWHGDTPLHVAAGVGKHKIIKRMLSVAPNPQDCVFATNAELRTPLHYAAGSGKPKAVSLLLQTKEQQALKESADEFGALPFHFAARSGDVESMEKLLLDNVNVACKNGLTALHYAAWDGRVAAVKKLMDKGATLNEGSDTPLHLAAISPKPERESVVEAIISKFPESWKMANGKGELAIGLAHECDHGDVIRAALRALRKSKSFLTGYDILNPKHKTSGATLLHFVAAHGTKDDIEWLATALEKTKPVSAIHDGSGRSPLHWAAIKGNASFLKAHAVSLNEDLIQKGDGHETPLFLALGADHLNFAEELLKCDKEKLKLDPTAKCLSTGEWMKGVEFWWKSFYETKVKEQVRTQLESEFKRHTTSQNVFRYSGINIGNVGGINNLYEEIPPVYLALHARKLGIAKFFQRLDEDAVNNKGIYTGRTALHWAVLLRRRDIVELLCDKEPSFKDRVRACEEDAQGISPVQYATERNMQDIEAVLFKRNAVKDYIDGLYRDRQIYVDSTNAILVGAALIASVTFAGWLQPPLGVIDHYYNADIPYVPIRQVKGMRIFWVFNSSSFFAAIGTVQAGACGVLPLRHVHIGRAVNYIRRALMVASLLMALSVVCVLGAFGAAGFIVLPPKFKFDLYMMVTVVVGGLINVGLIFWFMQRILLAPRLFKVWRRHLLWGQEATQQSSPPPDLTVPDGEAALPSPQASSPRPSMERAKPSFPWNDGIEKLLIEKHLNPYPTVTSPQ
ncbi:hypothetical protein GOP47_0015807 [Adiantum capillus-veneris]|uniref:PGG domain-containing protein n=1 Tax=Adiantum capillus-veneris TaxID=13818 RepID=A0A9D4ZEB7_ADICA|nr:hypothetical protein GOP47_0015807 [Adiantum capillus-veneris]